MVGSKMLRSSLHLLCVALLSASVASADDRYKLKETAPATGTRIRQDVAFWDLPFDKRYAELSENEKGKVRAMYEDLPPECEPPFPEKGLKHLVEQMIQIQTALLERGSVFAIAAVDESGNVQNVSFYETPSANMAKALGYVLVKERFKPAMCNGQNMPMEFVIRTRFKVRLGAAQQGVHGRLPQARR